MSIVRWFLHLFRKAHMPTIRLINHSTHVTAVELAQVAAAQQVQVHRDLFPVWGRDATIKVGKRAKAGEWRFVLADSIDAAGALGYHTVRAGIPTAIIDVSLCLQDGVSWSSCLSHEVLEALVDPLCMSVAPYPGGRQVALEVGDPVERSGYLINGVDMSNFVTPAWFQGGAGPFDFLGHLNAALTLEAGGYISVLDGSGWHQVFGDGISQVPARYTRGHDRTGL